MTARLVKTYAINITTEATLTNVSNGKSNAQMINIPVITIDKTGVLNFLLIKLIFLGSRLSLLKANGYRDADIIPAFAVVIKANKAAIDIITNPGVPIIILDASASGVRELEN